MKPAVLLSALLFFLFAAASAIPAAAQDNSDSDDIRQMVDATVAAIKPALVRIHVVSVEPEDGREVKRESFGSGAIITEDGCAITNHHVAGHATQITCTMADKTEIDAELIGSDALSDIAVIKLKPEKKRNFAVAKFGNSDDLKVGDRVLAMGSPLAFSQSVTMGIISNTELIVPDAFSYYGLELDGENVGSIVRWLAHDADIYPGNSGGPLVNLSGEIVGINEIKLGLGGAIPGNLACEIADQLMKDGRVRRSWLGLTIQPLLKSLQRDTGVMVSGTIEGSPAQKAGFEDGDILLTLAGKDCSVRFEEEMPVFNHYVMSLPIGKETEAVVLRDGKKVTMKVTPIDKGDAKAKEHEFKEWGICASNITRLEAIELKRDSTDGVLVTTLRSGGPARNAKPALTDEDVIVELAGKPVKNIQNLRTITQSVVADQDDPVPTLVGFERDGGKLLTVVKLGITEMQDPGLEVRKAWLPASTQVLTEDIAEALGMKGQSGVRITEVYPRSTAEKAGLKIGDIVIALDGMPIAASRPEHIDVFPAMIRQYKIGTEAELTVIRDGNKQKISVELIESPKLAREMKKYRNDSFDFTVRDIGQMDRFDEEWKDSQTGVLVTSAIEGGWASLGGLSSGDLIVAVENQPVTDVESFEKLMDNIAAKKPRTVVLKVKRDIRDAFVELRPSWSQD